MEAYDKRENRIATVRLPKHLKTSFIRETGGCV
jgi:hypothetical protein